MKTIDGVFGLKVHVFFGKKDFRKHAKTFGVQKTAKAFQNNGNAKAGKVKHKGRTSYLMVFNKHPHLDVVVHECVHMMEFIEERYNIDDKEFRAYLTQSLFRKVFRLIRERWAVKGK